MDSRIRKIEADGVSDGLSVWSVAVGSGRLVVIRGPGGDRLSRIIRSVLSGDDPDPSDARSVCGSGGTVVDLELDGSRRARISMDPDSGACSIDQHPGPARNAFLDVGDLGRRVFGSDAERAVLEGPVRIGAFDETSARLSEVVAAETGKNGRYPAGRSARLQTALNRHRFDEIELKEIRGELLTRQEYLMDEKMAAVGRVGEAARSVVADRLAAMTPEDSSAMGDAVYPLTNPVLFSAPLFDSISTLQSHIQRIDHPVSSMPGYLRALEYNSKCICGRDMDVRSRIHVSEVLSGLSVRHPYGVIRSVRETVGDVQRSPQLMRLEEDAPAGVSDPLTQVTYYNNEAAALKMEIDMITRPGSDYDPHNNLAACRAAIQEARRDLDASIKGQEMQKRAAVLEEILADARDMVVSALRVSGAETVNGAFRSYDVNEPFRISGDSVAELYSDVGSATVNALYLAAVSGMSHGSPALVVTDPSGELDALMEFREAER
ncbi:MAG: hypothetical protein Q4Q58_00400 [Thermoplasmata archaeon]|nr:hypothetical protein [Thermoplasmata archaeon]